MSGDDFCMTWSGWIKFSIYQSVWPRTKFFYLLRFNQLELHAPARPGDGSTVGRILQECNQKLPQLQGSSPVVNIATLVIDRKRKEAERLKSRE